MCEFVFRPSLWKGDTEAISEPWQCPYPTPPDCKYCAFHLTPPQRRQIFSSREELYEEYKRAIKSINRLVLICSTVQLIDLEAVSHLLKGTNSVQIGYSYVERINLERTHLPSHLVVNDSNISEIVANDSQIQEQLRIRNSTVGLANFAAAEIQGRSILEGNTIQDGRFTGARFEDTVAFNEEVPEGVHTDELDEYQGKNPTQFEETALFYGVEFGGLADFSGVCFENGATFFEAEFTAGADFSSTELKPGGQFEGAEFHNGASFSQADLGKSGFQKAEFSERAVFDRASFGDDRVDTKFINENDWPAMYEDFLRRLKEISVSFNACKSTREFSMLGVESNEGLLFHGAEFESIKIEAEIADDRSLVTFRDGVVHSGEITISESAPYLVEFTEATVGDVDVEAEGELRLFDYLFFSNTDFDGFDFPKYRPELRRANWVIDSVEADDQVVYSNRRETTYAKAKSGANEFGDSHATSEFFIRELRFRRQRHWENMREFDSFMSKVSSSVKWLSNLTFDISCKYAESSGRVVLLSTLSILLFGLVYGILGLTLPYSVSDEPAWWLNVLSTNPSHLVFSIQSFTAFLLGGGAEVEDAAIRAIASIESFVGAFLIGLFVATVVRSVER